jgi:hypothetical protein
MSLSALVNSAKSNKSNEKFLTKGLGMVLGGSVPWEMRYINTGLLSKTGEVIKRPGLLAALGRSGKVAADWGPGQHMFGIPITPLTALYAFGAAPRGHRLARGAASLLSGLGAAAGALVGGPLGAIVGAALFDKLANKTLTASFQSIADLDKKQHDLGMGGHYTDTELNYTMRMAAAKEMSGSLFNARQHLGREGRLLHN